MLLQLACTALDLLHPLPGGQQLAPPRQRPHARRRCCWCRSMRRRLLPQLLLPPPMWRRPGTLLRITWRLAGMPTSRSPSLVNATMEGVVRCPSAFSITFGDCVRGRPEPSWDCRACNAPGAAAAGWLGGRCPHLALHDSNTRVCGAQVDADDLICPQRTRHTAEQAQRGSAAAGGRRRRRRATTHRSYLMQRTPSASWACSRGCKTWAQSVVRRVSRHAGPTRHQLGARPAHTPAAPARGAPRGAAW